MTSAISSQPDYIFDQPSVLPSGALKLTVLRGDAWVFTEGCNFILRTGEQRIVESISKPAIVRRAYTRGFAKVQVEVVA